MYHKSYDGQENENRKQFSGRRGRYNLGKNFEGRTRPKKPRNFEDRVVKQMTKFDISRPQAIKNVEAMLITENNRKNPPGKKKKNRGPSRSEIERKKRQKSRNKNQ